MLFSFYYNSVAQDPIGNVVNTILICKEALGFLDHPREYIVELLDLDRTLHEGQIGEMTQSTLT